MAHSQKVCVTAYSLPMSEENNRQNIPGYVSIKEAAKMLGISANRVYAYVEEGRLPSAKAAHVIMIPLEDVKKFKPHFLDDHARLFLFGGYLPRIMNYS